LAHVIEEHWMWADLQEYVDSRLLEQIVDGGAELNRSADVAPPVISAKLGAIDGAALDCGDEGNCRADRAQVRQLLAQRSLDHIHCHAVKGIIERQQTIESAGMKQSLLKQGLRSQVARALHAG
jgi:hypothetical protein